MLMLQNVIKYAKIEIASTASIPVFIILIIMLTVNAAAVERITGGDFPILDDGVNQVALIGIVETDALPAGFAGTGRRRGEGNGIVFGAHGMQMAIDGDGVPGFGEYGNAGFDSQSLTCGDGDVSLQQIR